MPTLTDSITRARRVATRLGGLMVGHVAHDPRIRDQIAHEVRFIHRNQRGPETVCTDVHDGATCTTCGAAV